MEAPCSSKFATRLAGLKFLKWLDFLLFPCPASNQQSLLRCLFVFLLWTTLLQLVGGPAASSKVSNTHVGWHFFNFFTNKKLFFVFFIKLIWLGVGFLNRTGAEIGYKFDKKCNKIIFYYCKNSNIRTESAQLWCAARPTTRLRLILPSCRELCSASCLAWGVRGGGEEGRGKDQWNEATRPHDLIDTWWPNKLDNDRSKHTHTPTHMHEHTQTVYRVRQQKPDAQNFTVKKHFKSKFKTH